MMPKMSRMVGTKMTSRLTTKMRQTAMRMCRIQLKGLSGKKLWSKALRICRDRREDHLQVTSETLNFLTVHLCFLIKAFRLRKQQRPLIINDFVKLRMLSNVV